MTTAIKLVLALAMVCLSSAAQMCCQKPTDFSSQIDNGKQNNNRTVNIATFTPTNLPKNRKFVVLKEFYESWSKNQNRDNTSSDVLRRFESNALKLNADALIYDGVQAEDRLNDSKGPVVYVSRGRAIKFTESK